MKNRALPHFGTHIYPTTTFVQQWQRLPLSAQKVAGDKIRLLALNRQHPSLCVHRHVNTDLWECYLSHRLRLLFAISKKKLFLHAVGSHTILDRTRRRPRTSPRRPPLRKRKHRHN